MKEYLVKSSVGGYLYTNDVSCCKSDDVVEIQSGVNYVAERDGKLYFASVDELPDGYVMVWQRSETEFLMQGKNGERLMESVGQVKHSHYKKDISHLKTLDVYRVLELFNVTDPCIQHAVKKLLCSGQRGLKDSDRDINEAIDSLQRYNEMRIENAGSKD